MKSYFVLILFLPIWNNCLEGQECPFVRGGCCSGFYREKTSGNCTECPDGYFGINCSEMCDHGYYGFGCLAMCGCQEDEICNHKVGCITYTETTVFLSTHVLTKSTASGISYTTNATSEDTEETVLTAPNSILNNVIVLGILSISIALNVLVVLRLMKKKCPCRRKTSREIEIHQGQESQVPGVYDYVDEHVVARHFQSGTDSIVANVQVSTGSSSSSDEIEMNVVSEDTSGYLNPYQPLQAEWQKHTHVYTNREEMVGHLQSPQSLSKGYKDQTTQTEWQKHTHVYTNTEDMKGYLQPLPNPHKVHKDQTTQTEPGGRRIKSA